MDLICRICLEEVEANNWVCLFVALYDTRLFSSVLQEFASVEVIQNDHMPEKICNKCLVALVNAYEFRNTIKISDRKLRLKTTAEKTNQIDLGLVKVEDNNSDFEDANGATENSFLANTNEYESMDFNNQFENTDNKTVNTVQMSLKQSNDPLIDEALDIFDSEPNERVIGNIPELHKISEIVGENIYRNTQLRSLSESIDNYGVFLKNENLSQINIVQSSMSQNKFPNNDILMLPKLVPISSNEGVHQKNVAQSIMPRNTLLNNDNLLLPKLVPISKTTAPKLDSKSPDNDEEDPLHSTLKINNRTAYRCKDCNKTFIVKRSYVIHRNSHLGIRLHPCKICNKSFATPATLKLHNYIHTGEKLFECKVCNKKFRTPSTLIIHRQIHVEGKQFCCDKCDKRFRQNSGLKSHMNSVHTEDRRYICEICSKRFKDLLNLKKHGLVHTNERNHPCSECGKKFKTIYAMREHQKRHLGIKSHKCEVCHKAVSSTTVLKVHMRIHEGTKPYSCKVCFKAFRQSRTLQLHLLTHSNETPYHCTVCDKKFRYNYLLKSHKQKYHAS